ncbi:hypothetical protein LTR94_014903 [Friedmanniomyces endolithicus]|nr:hypothetical protein LTR94_014903 [Friedmanniomyces endolithicus]
MTTFDDRERAFENMFAHDQEMQFRIQARRNRLLGEWAAAKMGLTPEETDAYAKAVVQADFEEAGDEDVIRKLLGDMTQAGLDIDEAGVRTALDEQAVIARHDIAEMIKTAIPDAQVEITDLAGDGDHYAAKVVSESFRGMTRVAQQRAVYAALGGRMGGVLHALQLTTAVPN